MTTPPPGTPQHPGAEHDRYGASPGDPARPGDPTLFNGSTVHGFTGKRGIRHPWEMRLLITGVVLTILGYLAWTALIIGTVYLYVAEGRQTVDTLWQYVGVLPIFVQLAVLLPLAPIIYWWIRATMYAQLRTSAVRMSPTQFPEGYRIVVEAAQQYGMRRVPDAYVQLGNGTINAFAAGHGFRRFVVVYSDLFEIGGEVRDPQALRFVIGHEVGHLAAGHVAYFRLVFSTVINMIPILGPALSRSQEYTADNFGHSFAPAGSPGMMGVLSGGKYLGAEVNVHELADRAATDPSLFVHWVNLMSSHPVTTWRAHALRDRSKPGALWIRPSGAVFRSPLPPGHVWSSQFPTPGDARALLEAADRSRPAGTSKQFGRFPGADYSGRPATRAVQLAVPQLSGRTTYEIPSGPYRDDARGLLTDPRMNPFGRQGQEPPREGPAS
ncbi:M48 family metallopeptidase [Brachybacterium sacelli]|uniref:Zn-dependent protease with chaperone function n=1 Tax=Brachybacterium sacelli TaxID=173364 RepID=A0ABS4WY10_9MICO|nr:M48 family metallopeptidase [Brachybacterium sacelli]MBP2381081.1 Zn-dependent protease with chaperone function [Brachybacterium sacelli]